MEFRRSPLSPSLRHVALIGFLLSSAAHADFYLRSWENEHEDFRWLKLEGKLHSLSSTQNFDAGSAKVTPSSLRSYGQLGLDLEAAYGLSDRISGFARLAWSRVSVDATNLNADAFGFTDQSVGLNVRALKGSLPLDFQIQADLPLYDNAGARAEKLPFLGDGSVDVTAGAFLGIPLMNGEDQRIVASFGGGYTLRGGGFSSALPYSFQAAMLPTRNGLIAGVGFTGFLSLKTDTQPGASPTLGGDSSGTGGSYMSNAVNPSILRARLALGWKLDSASDTRLGLQLEAPLRGENAPAGTVVSAGIQLRFAGEGAPPSAYEPETKARRKHKTGPEIGGTGFISYSLEAKVTQVNDRLNLIKINKGLHSNVEMGQLFDLFSARPDGTVLELIARAKVTAVKEEEAALEVSEYYKETWIDQGFVAKRVTTP
jgi:hypothetical protein